VTDAPADDAYIIPHETLVRLGRGDPARGRKRLRALIDLECVREPINGPTERPARVRMAVPADEDAIMALVRRDLDENARMIAPLDEGEVLTMVRAAWDPNNPTRPTIGVAEADSALVAMTVLVPYRWWWSKEWFIQEMMTYVDPEHRGRRYDTDLLRFGRWLSDAMTSAIGTRVYLLSGVTATHDELVKASLYRRQSNMVGIFCCYPDPVLRRR
jgi:GNAT superfamily N-acetyltransferase